MPQTVKPVPFYGKRPRVTWVLRSFLDYRIPVFAALDNLLDRQLHVIFPTGSSPPRVQKKIIAALGQRAIALNGEKSIGVSKPQMANTSLCIPFQPGILKAISKTEPDILIGDGFFQWTSMALSYKAISKTPLVICYERTHHTERNAQWYRKMYRKTVSRFVDAYCVNGQQSFNYLVSLGISKAKITTGFMAADTDGLAAQCQAVSAAEKEALRQQWQVNCLVFLFAGQLIKRKGGAQLLKAWSLFEQAMPGVATLVLIGTGPEEANLKQLARSLALKSICFQGKVEYDRMARHYAAADVFVMPTLEDNWSLVVPEAMACGLPVLTSHYNGCWPELVHPNQNGWVFDSFDAHDVLQCLEACVNSKADLKRMGQYSKETVSQHTPNRAAQAILHACQLAWGHRQGRSQ